MIEIENTSVDYDIQYGEKWAKKIEKNDKDIGWHINSINAPKAWEFCNKNKSIINPVRIGIIDYTFDTIHEDLDECAVDNYYDNVGEFARQYKNGELEYGKYAHGTHVFGTFAADAGNTGGICGVYPYGRGNTFLASWKGSTVDYTENDVSAVSYKCYIAELVLRNVKGCHSRSPARRQGAPLQDRRRPGALHRRSH